MVIWSGSDRVKLQKKNIDNLSSWILFISSVRIRQTWHRQTLLVKFIFQMKVSYSFLLLWMVRHMLLDDLKKMHFERLGVGVRAVLDYDFVERHILQCPKARRATFLFQRFASCLFKTKFIDWSSRERSKYTFLHLLALWLDFLNLALWEKSPMVDHTYFIFFHLHCGEMTRILCWRWWKVWNQHTGLLGQILGQSGVIGETQSPIIAHFTMQIIRFFANVQRTYCWQNLNLACEERWIWNERVLYLTQLLN